MFQSSHAVSLCEGILPLQSLSRLFGRELEGVGLCGVKSPKQPEPIPSPSPNWEGSAAAQTKALFHEEK